MNLVLNLIEGTTDKEAVLEGNIICPQPLRMLDLESVAALFRSEQHIVQLRINGYFIGMEVMKGLRSIIAHNSLRKVDFSFSRIERNETIEIVDILTARGDDGRRSLVGDLNLSFTGIGITAIPQVARTLESVSAKLRSLTLRYNAITGQGLGLILKWAIGLTHLDCSYCGILRQATGRESSLSFILEGIRENTACSLLQLQGNGISSAEQQRIFEEVACNKRSSLRPGKIIFTDPRAEFFNQQCDSLNHFLVSADTHNSHLAEASELTPDCTLGEWIGQDYIPHEEDVIINDIQRLESSPINIPPRRSASSVSHISHSRVSIVSEQPSNHTNNLHNKTSYGSNGSSWPQKEVLNYMGRAGSESQPLSGWVNRNEESSHAFAPANPQTTNNRPAVSRNGTESQKQVHINNTSTPLSIRSDYSATIRQDPPQPHPHPRQSLHPSHPLRIYSTTQTITQQSSPRRGNITPPSGAYVISQNSIAGTANTSNWQRAPSPTLSASPSPSRRSSPTRRSSSTRKSSPTRRYSPSRRHSPSRKRPRSTRSSSLYDVTPPEPQLLETNYYHPPPSSSVDYHRSTRSRSSTSRQRASPRREKSELAEAIGKRRDRITPALLNASMSGDVVCREIIGDHLFGGLPAEGGKLQVCCRQSYESFILKISKQPNRVSHLNWFHVAAFQTY